MVGEGKLHYEVTTDSSISQYTMRDPESYSIVPIIRTVQVMDSGNKRNRL
jgi:hypothetical protein